MAKFDIALCQHRVRDSIEENLKAAAKSVGQAAKKGADIVVLPEMFICHFIPLQMRACAQTISGSVVKTLSETAAAHRVWLVGGSFPELDDSGFSGGRESLLYNTCPVFAPDGTLAGTYRKRFLFDVDIPGKVRSCESVVFTPGDRSLTVDAGFVKFGVALCFDIRFPQLFIEMAKDGAEIIFVPAAFSSRTGPDHWELLNRARALDAQVFVAGTDIAANEEAPFPGHGYSCVTDPWGRIVAGAGPEEEILMASIDTERVTETRQGLVVLAHQPSVPTGNTGARNGGSVL